MRPVLVRASTPAPRRVPPDVHGEPLALLPRGPLLWFRADAVTARSSRHWPAVAGLIESSGGEFVRQLERELGFDALRSASALALALYAPPGARPERGGPLSWPVLYARGGFEREQVLMAARARAPADRPLSERTLDGMRYYASASRAYLFPADDVVIMFDPAMAPRVIRRLRGEETESALGDARFASLWAQVGGAEGTVQLAADLGAMRALGGPTQEQDPSASLETAVLRIDAPDEVHARLAAFATSEDEARRLVTSVDEIRTTMLQRLEVRLLGLTRLLNQGITAVNEGRLVRVGIDASAAEAHRVLGSLRMLQAISN